MGLSAYTNLVQPFESHLRHIRSIVENDGPEPDQYASHLAWYSRLNEQIEQGQISEQQRDQLRDAFGAAYSASTLQGYVYRWPLGYPGDYRMIEKIYANSISTDPKFEKYDLFFQSQTAPTAVRNRKQYFKHLVRELCKRCQQPITVLNLASGPCREIRELFDDDPELPVKFQCVDIDEHAVKYAKVVLGRHADKVTFITENIFRLKPTSKFSLIWSAGLFDYFDDRTFWRILKRYVPLIDAEGELVIGNFGEQNSTKGYMEAIGKWYLHHRSDAKLVELAQQAGASSLHQVNVGFESTGLNRFLHISRSAETIRIDLPQSIAGPNVKAVEAETPVIEP